MNTKVNLSAPDAAHSWREWAPRKCTSSGTNSIWGNFAGRRLRWGRARDVLGRGRARYLSVNGPRDHKTEQAPNFAMTIYVSTLDERSENPYKNTNTSQLL